MTGLFLLGLLKVIYDYVDYAMHNRPRPTLNEQWAVG